MRIIMLLASIGMLGTGTFCIANSSVAVGSVAFVIGVIFCIVGACELLILRGAEDLSDYVEKEYFTQAVVMIIVGIAFLSGQLVDESTVTMMFALWMTYEGAKALADARLEIRDNSREQNTSLILAVLNALLGTYMFFNTSLLGIKTLTLVGICIILLGITRYRMSAEVNYRSSGFLTGHQERLAEAEREEKKAMAKAKEGIRESKEAHRRVEKIKAEMQDARRAETSTAIRSNEIE